ncbi:MAG: DUF5942 domain-containing protein, partial [Microcystaceae cyanobacterium]
FDGGAIAFLPKLGMVMGSYLLAFILRYYFPFAWTGPLNWGLILGSSGLFFLQGWYIFDLPQWPFRVLGSSIPELGNSLQGGTLLNPFFASALIPFVLIILLLGNKAGKSFAVGTTIGVATCLTVSAILTPSLWLIGSGAIAQTFLGVNVLLCLGLVYLATKGDERLA